MLKRCKRCSKTLDISEFHKNKDSKDGYENICRFDKWINKNRKEYHKMIKLVNFLKTQKCVDCGNNDVRVLTFDHRKEKKHNIIRMLNNTKFTWQDILDEIANCEMRCCNCHTLRHTIEMNDYRQQWWGEHANKNM